ncbi:NTP transferase domain-containing protein, partial [Escherichia coli]|nr:NTP transferase domain-containing protein [Escherichia coli]
LVVVVGHGGDRVREMVGATDIAFATQDKQLGTGHAVMQAVDQLDESVPTLVLYGDVPLTRAETLSALVSAAGNDHLGVLTVHLGDPTGYGRIVRDAAGRITRIVEQKDANETQLAIHEVNTGILVCPTAKLKNWLATLSNDNAQGEYY